MKLSKTSACCFALIATMAGFLFVSSATAEEWGFDFWHINELEQQMACHESRMADLEKANQGIAGRTSLRQGIINNLCAKEITLQEAASGFLTLNQTEPLSMKYLSMTHPNRSDHELAIIQVMMHVKNAHGKLSEIYLSLSCEAIEICGPNFE